MVEGTTKAVRGRSPNYPGVNLEVALQRAQRLYERERTNTAHFDTIIRHWGYQSASGSARVTFAALRKFGLLSDEGTGDKKRARLSDLALRIVQDTRPNSADRQNAVREAALTPTIHKDLWEDFHGALPSDENLRFSLIRERGFTESGAEEFIREFKDTVAFAGLADAPIDQAGKQDGDRDDEIDSIGLTSRSDAPLQGSNDARTRSIQLPLNAGKWATLQASFPLVEEDWSLMLAVLEAMKPGLVTSQSSSEPGVNLSEAQTTLQEE